MTVTIRVSVYVNTASLVERVIAAPQGSTDTLTAYVSRCLSVRRPLCKSCIHSFFFDFVYWLACLSA